MATQPIVERPRANLSSQTCLPFSTVNILFRAFRRAEQFPAMRVRMCFDDLAWERSERVSDTWVANLFKNETLMTIGEFILKHRQGKPVELCDPKAGAFNVSFRMTFEDGGSAIIRFPKPGATMFPEEKVRNEVAIIRYIHEHTEIPVPFVLHWGTKEESPLGLGPFIIMDHIDHAMSMSDALNTPGFADEDRPILNHDIQEEKLEMLYKQVADIVLQLSTLSLPKIGSLSHLDDFTWEVTQRPLSINMNELVRVVSLPRLKLPKPTATFETASAYFNALADLHLDHLICQRNDSVDSETDCRRKYTARKLFHRLITEGGFTATSTDNGPFKLWCDDLRPSNILLDENLQVVGVVDWEFTYAAPVEFSHAPPWWLLLEQPEYWPDGIEAWKETYQSRFQTFLKVLREREDVGLGRGTLKKEQRLSDAMDESWKAGDFWVVYAAKKNFAFDIMFWKKLDERYFGPRISEDENAWQERFELLGEKDREEMDQIIKRKLDEMEDRVLAWEPEEVNELGSQRTKVWSRW